MLFKDLLHFGVIVIQFVSGFFVLWVSYSKKPRCRPHDKEVRMASQCLSHQSIESPRRSYLCKARRVQCRERGNDWVHSFTPAQTHAFPTQSDLEYELAKDSLSSCNKACKVMLCYVGTPCCVHLFTDKAPQFGQAAFANNLKAWNSIKSTDLFCILHFAWLFYGTKPHTFWTQIGP